MSHVASERVGKQVAHRHNLDVGMILEAEAEARNSHGNLSVRNGLPAFRCFWASFPQIFERLNDTAVLFDDLLGAGGEAPRRDAWPG